MSRLEPLDRRQFFQRVAVAGAAIAPLLPTRRFLAAQSPSAPINVKLGKAVLTSSDFGYLGAFLVPQNDSMNTPWQMGLTHRYVGGSLRLYTTGYPNFPLYEFSVPSLATSGPYNAATRTANFGDIYGGKRTTDSGGANVRGLYWDEVDQRMYWVFQDDYNPTAPNNACLGYSVLNDSAKTGTAVKAVRMPASVGCIVANGGLTGVPAWFASHVGRRGCRLAVGFGGKESGGLPMSMGPALAMLDPADITATPDQGYMSAAYTLLRHATLSQTYGSGHYRARRSDLDYYTIADSGWNAGVGSSGWWGWDCQLRQGACWIDTPAKSGFLIIPTQLTRASSNGPHSGSQTSTVGSGSTTHVVLSRPIDGLEVGEVIYVAASYAQGSVPAQVTQIAGLSLTVTDATSPGSPLPSVPTPGGNVVRGEFYAASQPWFSRLKHTWYIYNPLAMASSKGLGGSVASDSIPWASAWDQRFPGGVSYPIHSSGGVPANIVTGMTFDTVTSRLYVRVRSDSPYSDLIHVYKVS
jgi:hypothetical protein